MALRKLTLKDHEASFGVGKGWRDGWQLGWNVSMPRWDESVELSNGKDLGDMPGLFHIRGGEVEARDENGIGALHFLSAQAGSSDGVVKASPDSYSVEIVLTEGRVRTLLDLVQRGHGPSEVSVSVPGLEYGWAPDGSIKKWELQDDRNWLAVDGLTFWFRPESRTECDPIGDMEPEPEPGPSAEARRLAS